MSNVSIKKTANLFPAVKPLALVICALLNTGLATQVVAAPGDRIGDELGVNTVSASQQQEASIATNANGASVITWVSRRQASANGYDIFAQRYTVNGEKEGNEFLVNIVGTNKHAPDVAISDNGDFVIVWRSNQQDGDGNGIYGQRYTSNGNQMGNEFLVNTNIVDDQENPQVAMDANGNFVVTWQSFDAGNDYDVFAQRFSADGNTISGEFLVNTDTTSIQSNPSIAMNAAGNFVVTWQSGSNNIANVYGQRYLPDGNTIGGEFMVNTYVFNGQLNPSVAMDASGAFVVAWDSLGQEPVPATSGGSTEIGVYAQRFDTNGNKIGTDILVNTETTADQSNPNIAMNSGGDFVVTWQSEEQTAAADGRYDIYAQRFNNAGNAIGNEFLVNTEIEDDQEAPAVAMDNNGNFVVIWQSDNQATGDSTDILAQRYEGEMNNSNPTNSGSNSSGGALSWLLSALFLPLTFRRKQKG